MWETFDALPDVLYHEDAKGVEWHCSIQILGWKNRSDYPEKKSDIVAEVFGKLLYGQPKINVVFYQKEAKYFLHCQKSIAEAKEVIEIELQFAKNG